MGRVSHAAPQGVVDRDQPARAQQLQAALVVGVVAGLVGIDEGEVVLPGGAGREAGVERRERRRQLQVDLVRDAGLLPVWPADPRVGFADVAGEQLAVVGQRQRHRERAVAGEDADLERATSSHQPHQQRHELALLGRDLHAAVRLLARGGAQGGLRGVLAQRVIQQVVVERVVQVQGAARHGRCLRVGVCGICRRPRSYCLRSVTRDDSGAGR